MGQKVNRQQRQAIEQILYNVARKKMIKGLRRILIDNVNEDNMIIRPDGYIPKKMTKINYLYAVEILIVVAVLGCGLFFYIMPDKATWYPHYWSESEIRELIRDELKHGK